MGREKGRGIQREREREGGGGGGRRRKREENKHVSMCTKGNCFRH